MSSSTSRPEIGWTKLAHAWSKKYGAAGPGAAVNANNNKSSSSSAITHALVRTMPLLDGNPEAVPFVCRYRQDVIAPLTTKLIHELAADLQTHRSLAALRTRILDKLSTTTTKDSADLTLRVQTSISKTELEDLYAPFKPPSKGSLEDRIKQKHPELVEAVDQLWLHGTSSRKLKPFDSAVTLLANRIAGHPETLDAVQDYTNHWCRIKVVAAQTASKTTSKTTDDSGNNTFQTYHDFSAPIHRLRDHQVLAIRRGVDKKALKLSFDMDGDRATQCIRHSLRTKTNIAAPWKDAIHDAWTRLLRKRCTARAWKAVCDTADDRAVAVFCDNLRKALLAPPAAPPQALLALDPGFKAGIKTAMVDRDGRLFRTKVSSSPSSLNTVHFMGKSVDQGKAQLMELLTMVNAHNKGRGAVAVALGNGHGTQEARRLVLDASQACDIPIDIHLVNEAGASVWSVTEAAAREFPNDPPSAIAAVSIARRYQNPLPELVKIPPRSLGLGMYQHDFAEKVLDGKLHSTSVDAVAEVGVDANACSLEILEKVPGMTKALSEKIIQARPIRNRQDLLTISGLGPKTYENCAAFLRVHDGSDDLDRTMCHPESYKLAKYLLRHLRWDLNDPTSVVDAPPHNKRSQQWKEIIAKASNRYHVSEERILSVMDQLIRSISNDDPRLMSETSTATTKTSTNIGSTNGCSPLAAALTPLNDLRKACPVRSVIGHVRNIVDFGIFVDFGGENDGLIHRSKLGSVSIDSFLVGQEVGVDILGVSSANKVTVSLSGLNLNAETMDDSSKRENTMKRRQGPVPKDSRKRRKVGTKARS